MLLTDAGYEAAAVAGECEGVHKARHGDFEFELYLAEMLLQLPHTNETVT